MPFGNNCICNRQNCTRFARAITLPIAHAIIPKSHSNPCDYPYKLCRHNRCMPICELEVDTGVADLGVMVALTGYKVGLKPGE